MLGPATRLAAVRPDVPVSLAGAVLVESWSNDTWVTGQSVLRVCWRGDRGRLLREQALLAALPGAVPHAEVLGAGQAGDLTWMAMRRVAGERLDLVWPRLADGQRRAALRRLGAVLAALHRWAPPPAVRAMHQPGRPDIEMGHHPVQGDGAGPGQLQALAAAVTLVGAVPRRSLGDSSAACGSKTERVNRRNTSACVEAMPAAWKLVSMLSNLSAPLFGQVAYLSGARRITFGNVYDP